MRIKRRSRSKTFQIVDMAPMADVVFLLLIFFMLSSTFVIQPGIKIRLPEAESSEIQPEEKLIITIARDEKLYLNDRLVKLDTLTDDIRRSFAQRKDKLVVLKADKRVSHGFVVSVLDKARSAGAQRLAIASDKVKQK